MPNPGKGPTLCAALLAVAALSGAPAPAESPAGPAALPPTDQEIDAWFARIPAGEAAQVEEEVRGRIAALEGTPHAETIVMTHLLSVLSQALVLGGKASEPATMALAERNLALTERVVGTEHQLYARALTDCGRVALQGGNYPIARGYAERSLALRERLLPPGDPSIGRALVSLGTVVQKAGDPAEGRRLMERGLAIYEKAEKVDPLWIPAGNMTLGILLIDLRELDEAEMRLTRARDGLTGLYGEKNPHVANAINALGIVHELKGDLVRARDDYERALAIQVAVLPSENPYIAGILHNLSLVSHNMGDTAAAAEFERRALAMSEKTWGPDHQETLRGRHALGIYLGALGESAEAERFLAAALAGREKSLGPDHFDTAESLAGLADLYVDTGRAEEALPLLLRALAVRETALGPDHPIVALSLSSLARCEARLGRREAARLHSERALAIREARLGPDHPDVARNLDALARLNFEDGRRATARDQARRAAALLAHQARDTIAALPERRALLLVGGQPHPEEILFSGLLTDTSDREKWLDACWEWVLARRGIVLEELAGRNRRALVADTPEAQAAWSGFAAARARLASLWAGGDGDDPEAHQQALETARRDREAAEVTLARRSAVYRDARAAERLSPAELRAALPRDSALVEWVRVRAGDSVSGDSPRRDIALLLGPQDASGFVDLGPSERIDAAVGAWRLSLEATSPAVAAPPAPGSGADPRAALRRAGEDLRRMVYDPVRTRVGAARRLFLVPDGALHAVDFAALPLGDGRYVIEAGPAIQILSTGRDLVRFARAPAPANAAGRGLLAIGGPDFAATAAARRAALPADRPGTTVVASAPFRGAAPPCLAPGRTHWAPLPASDREAQRIAELFRRREPALVLTGAAASEDRFKRDAAGRRVLHLATHGYFVEPGCDDPRSRSSKSPPSLENPLLRSGLVLAGADRREGAAEGGEDGILTAEEMAALDLRGVDLVALSACDTGRGEVAAGEGIFGLRRAIEIAGARSVLMSLWSVPDQASSRFMTRFYRDRLAGTSAPEAARAAALAALADLRDREAPEHPYLWAGFVTAGDWR